MAEFEDTLSSLLSNPEAMGQIMSFAKTLSGEHSNAPTPPPSEREDTPSGASGAPFQIGDLLSGLSGGLDPSMINMVGKVLQEYLNNNKEDKNMALIAALRPFLKEKRQSKVDQAIQIAKLSRIARVAYQTIKGGESSV